MLRRPMTEITKLKKGQRNPRPTVLYGNDGTDSAARRFRTMEAASLRLQKEAKGYLDSLRGRKSPCDKDGGAAELIQETAMTASQMRIAETIDAFYGDAGAKDGVSRSYKQAVEDLDAETIKALDGPYR
jgi:bridging integrator 3